jgi:hypothetical protein
MITQYRRIGWNRADAYAIFQRCGFVLATRLPQDLINAHGPEFHSCSAFCKPQRRLQLLELVFEPIDRGLAGLQQLSLPACPMPTPEKLVSTLNDLQRLTKVMRGDCEQHRFKIGDQVRLCNGHQASGPWPRGNTASVENVGASRSLDALLRMLHIVLSSGG